MAKKNIRKLVVNFFVICAIGMFAPKIMAEAEIDVSYEYTILEDGTIKVTAFPLTAIDSEGCICIPETIDEKKVTVLGASLFENQSDIVTVEMSEGIRKIEERCFYGCSELTTVELPETLEVIGEEAFYSCKNLQTMTLPESVTEIGGKAFWYTNWLGTARAPFVFMKKVWKKLESGSYLSDMVTGCKPVIMNNLLVEASRWIDYTGGTKEDELKVVEDYIIEDSVNKVCSYAFYTPLGTDGAEPMGNNNAVSITFGNPDTVLAPAAFYGCTALQEIVLPANLTTIEELTFGECPNLQSVEIPDGVTSVADNAFLNCTSLKTIKLPVSLETLGQNAFAGVVSGEDESSLVVTIPENLDVSNLGLENIINIQYITINVAEGSQAYIYLQQCENIVINTYPPQKPNTPASDDDQKPEADDDKNTTEAPTTETLPDDKTTHATETAQIGKIYTIDDLKYKVTSSVNVTVVGATKMKIKTVTIPSKVTILNQSFKVTVIGKKAFKKFKKLTAVTVGNNVKTIGDEAFMQCTKLKKITVGKNVKTIDKKAFYGDKKLKKMIFKGNKVTKIGKKAMRGVSGVKVRVPTNKAKKKYAKLLRKAK